MKFILIQFILLIVAFGSQAILTILFPSLSWGTRIMIGSTVTIIIGFILVACPSRKSQ